MQSKRPLSTGWCPHLLMSCIFTSGYDYRLSVHFVPCRGLAPRCPVGSVCRDNIVWLIITCPLSVNTFKFSLDVLIYIAMIIDIEFVEIIFQPISDNK